MPPLKSGISYAHAFAEPYISQAQPHIEPYVAPVSRAITTAKPYVVRAVSVARSVWNDTLVPLYTQTLKPYWVKAVIPRYNKYIHPRLLPLIKQAKQYYRYYVANPLHIQSLKAQRYIHTIYATNLKPYVAKVQPHIERTINTVHVTSVKTFQAYKTHAHPRIVVGWAAARPVLIRSFKQLKKFTCKFLDVGGKQLKKAIKEASGLRQTYVDPQVRKIWDKVAEGTDLATPSAPTITKLSEPSVQSTQETAESIAEPTTSTVATSTTIAPAPTTTQISDADNTPAAESPAPTPVEAAEDETDAPGHAGTHTAPPAHDTAPEVAQAAFKAGPATTDAPAPILEEGSVEPTTISEPVTPVPLPSSADIEEDIDLDAFLNDLGVTSSAAADTPAETTISVQEVTTPVQTPEEVLAEIAAKREEIVNRHNEWFVRLDDGIEEETVALSKALEEWRDLKAVELEDMKKRGVLENVQKDGEKFLKGLESFLKKAEGRSAAWKITKDKQKLEDITVEDKVAAYQEEFSAKKTTAKAEKDKWETVLSKVEERFAERVSQLQVEIHQWYMGMREKEGEEVSYHLFFIWINLVTDKGVRSFQVRESALRIKNLAERAQADLGLDYAWLEDVTYDDWQQYHDLVRMAEAFEQTAYGMQNNTLENAPRDPIMPLLDDLDQDTKDIVAGFQIALGKVRGDAAKVYSVNLGQVDDVDSGFFVVNDGQVRKDDLRGVDFGDLGLKKTEGAGVVKLRTDDGSKSAGGEGKRDEEVHILPIDSNLPVKEDQTVFDASKVIIGKDKVQIEQALKDVPVEHVHEEL